MAKFMEQRKKKQEEAKNKPKIEEIKKEPAFKKVEIAEGSDTDSDDAEELKQKQAAQKKSPRGRFNTETLSKAKDQALTEQTKSTLKQIPKTPAGFEKDFNALKGDEASLIAYLKNIPTATVEALFKKAEVPTEVLSGILKSIAGQDLESAEDKAWSGKFLLSLAKAKNFEMTLMFAGSGEHTNVDEIVSKIRKADSQLADKVKEEFTAE